MRDAIIVGVLIFAFATLVTAHAAIVFGLALRTPRWRAPVAFVVPPLAPFWAVTGGMRVRGIVWVASVVVYAVARALAAV